MRVVYDHRNGDTATGLKLMTDLSIDTFEKYLEVVILSSITDRITSSENAKLGQVQRKSPIPWGTPHNKRLKSIGITLVLEKPLDDPYKKPISPTAMERIKTGWKFLAFYRKVYYDPKSTDRDRKTALNRAGRDACKAISDKGVWSGWSSQAAMEIKKK